MKHITHSKRNQQLALLTATLGFGLFLSACGATPAPAPTPPSPTEQAATPAPETPTPAEEVDTPERDLGGMVITLGNWWGDYDTATSTAESTFDIARLEMRRAAEQRYNFTIQERAIGGWAEYQEIMINSILAGEPVATAFFSSIPWFTAAQSQNLFAPIDWDFSDRSMVPWMEAIREATTVAGNTYGFMHGYLLAPGIFFNTRLLQDAGLNPEEPFDLLMAGNWTWAEFERIVRATTRDLDNNGVIDTWGFSASPGWTLPGFVYSNMAYYVGRDAQGNLYDGSQSPNFFEALSFAMSLYTEGLVFPQGDGGWDWFMDAFVNGTTAMTTGFTWHSPMYEEQMSDVIGFIPFPKGPQATRHNFPTYYSLFGIAHQYAERTDDIMFALSHWWATPEGFEDPDAWVVEFLPMFSHPRSITDSIANFNRNQDLLQFELHRFVPGYSATALFDDRMWADGLDASTIIAESELVIASILADANN